MSIYEFLQRLDADPFDAELTALFARDDVNNAPASNPRGQKEES